jgi:hypothetical protein
MPNEPQENAESVLRIGQFQLTVSSLLKLGAIAIACIIAWSAQSYRMDSLSARLDSYEKQQNIYLRSDLQAERDAAVLAELQSLRENVNQRLERIEKKIDQVH